MTTKTEQIFIDKMVAKGWEVYHNGFPDFLCQKGNITYLVEVKATASEQLKPDQITMMGLLQNLGVECYRWSPDSELSKELTLSSKGMMKYQALTKLNRNLAIVALHQKHPEIRLREIGVTFPCNGKPLSKQRVWQIIQDYKNEEEVLNEPR